MERGLTMGTSLVDQVKANPMVQRASGCSCEIPAPCWMPKELPAVTSHVCEGARACLRLRVTNCTPRASRVQLVATGAGAGNVTLSPAELTLGVLERGVLEASLRLDDAARGTEREILIWVRGCVDHVVRWTIKTSSFGGNSCHELKVDDCPDYVHHWYDHFYCARPCRHGRD